MSRELANTLIILDRYMARVSGALKRARSHASSEMLPGERFAARIPGGDKSPGYILRKKDGDDAFVEDEAVLMAHLQDTDPDALEDVDEIDPEKLGVVLAHLKNTLPECVRSSVRINPTVLTGLLRAANNEPKKAAPGIGFKKVAGTVAVYADKEAVADLDDAIRSGQLSLDKALLQIEGGRDGDQNP